MKEKPVMAQRIRELRKAQGLTQAQLAAETGLKETAVRSYENGLREPNSKAMAALERYFSVSGEYLRGETDQRDVMKWDDPDIVAAVRQSLPKQVVSLIEILQHCPAQDQKLAFDILVQLHYVLKLEDAPKRMTALSILHDVAAAVEHLTVDN